MTSRKDIGGSKSELVRLVDAWGGDPARWPEDVRDRIERITAGEPAAAQALLAEARALDRLIDHGREAPAVLSPKRRLALADRIVATAVAEVQDTGDNVVMFRSRAVVRPAMVTRGQWRAAVVMAAGLVLGIYLGGSISLAPVLQEIADAIGIAADFEPTVVAAGDDSGDEDTL